MGCCLSTRPTKSKNPDVTPPNHNHHLPESHSKDRAPPPLPSPPVLEEETVKEVLSETPISRPPNPTPTTTEIPETTRRPKKIEPVDLNKPTEEIIVSEISEASEMCSFSGSFSATTLNDRREDEGEVTQRILPRSPRKTPRKQSYSGELSGAKDRGLRSPARRSAPSPVQSSQVPSRPVKGRERTPQPRNVGPINGIRRDSSQGSGRRSKSPPRRNVGYKMPALTTAVRSPVRTSEEGSLMKQDDGVSAESESLENPHVSLECFIFL